MFLQLNVLAYVLVSTAAIAQQYVAFDAASASSTYSAGNLAGSPAFAAQQALAGGSGYWSCNITCSCGLLFFAFCTHVRREGVPAAATLRGRVCTSVVSCVAEEALSNKTYEYA